VFFVVDGFNQTGKTDFVLKIMEWSYEYGYFKRFGLNQEIENAPFEWDYVTDLETLFNIVTNYKGKYLFFLDELGKTAPRSMPWKKITLELIVKMEVKRKDKLSFAGASIGDVDRRIVSPNYLDVHFKKRGLTHAKMNHLRKRYGTNLWGIFPTNIKFSEYKVAPFTLTPQSTTEPLWADWEQRLIQKTQETPDNQIWSSRIQKSRDMYKAVEAWINYRRSNYNGSRSVTEQGNATMQEDTPE